MWYRAPEKMAMKRQLLAQVVAASIFLALALGLIPPVHVHGHQTQQVIQRTNDGEQEFSFTSGNETITPISSKRASEMRLKVQDINAEADNSWILSVPDAVQLGVAQLIAERDQFPATRVGRIVNFDSGVHTNDPRLRRPVNGWGKNFVPDQAPDNIEDPQTLSHGHAVTSREIEATGDDPMMEMVMYRVVNVVGHAELQWIANALSTLIQDVDNGFQVDAVNMSLGFPDHSIEIRDLIVELGKRGVPVCIGAGNNGQDLSANPDADALAVYAAMAFNAQPIGALMAGQSVLWQGTNFGALVRQWAPGGDVVMLAGNGGFVTSSGTSFSSPVIAAAVAVRAIRHQIVDPRDRLNQVLLSSDTTVVTLPGPSSMQQSIASVRLDRNLSESIALPPQDNLDLPGKVKYTASGVIRAFAGASSSGALIVIPGYEVSGSGTWFGAISPESGQFSFSNLPGPDPGPRLVVTSKGGAIGDMKCKHPA
jgi:hypothetical protein